MADIRPASGVSLPVPARPLPAARAEAIRAAQRAFFDQALTGAAPSAPTTPVAPTPAATRLSFDSGSPRPSAPLRPGSLLDIKV